MAVHPYNLKASSLHVLHHVSHPPLRAIAACQWGVDMPNPEHGGAGAIAPRPQMLEPVLRGHIPPSLIIENREHLNIKTSP
jgi:hypothetical protein